MNIELHNDQEDQESRDEMLRVENEILQLKLQAETGAIFHQCEDVPPEVQNMFLHHVHSIEKAIRNSRLISIYEMLGNPPVQQEQEMSDEEVASGIRHFMELMQQKNLVFCLPETYNARHVYQYITQQVFPQEVHDLGMAGMFMHIPYDDGTEDPEELEWENEEEE